MSCNFKQKSLQNVTVSFIKNLKNVQCENIKCHVIWNKKIFKTLLLAVFETENLQWKLENKRSIIQITMYIYRWVSLFCQCFREFRQC